MRSTKTLAGTLLTALALLAAAIGPDGAALAQDSQPGLIPQAATARLALPAVLTQTIPDRIGSDQAKPDGAKPDQGTADQGTLDQGTADQRTGDAHVDGYPDATTLPELVSRQVQPDALPEQLNCLAGAIYFEAKGETLAGQLAVARVIVARAASGRFPGSYCGVVYQPSQFAFVQGRRMPPVRMLSAAWHEAVAIAQIADRGSWRSAAEGALYFHSARIAPKWRLTRIARVDDHVFYR